jgi:hypothetical protein
VASDASGFKVAITILEGMELPEKVITYRLSENEKGRSNGVR